jgi:hypothetical protein
MKVIHLEAWWSRNQGRTHPHPFPLPQAGERADLAAHGAKNSLAHSDGRGRGQVHCLWPTAKLMKPVCDKTQFKSIYPSREKFVGS